MHFSTVVLQHVMSRHIDELLGAVSGSNHHIDWRYPEIIKEL